MIVVKLGSAVGLEKEPRPRQSRSASNGRQAADLLKNFFFFKKKEEQKMKLRFSNQAF